MRGQPPDAPPTLRLATLTADGSIEQVLAQQSFAASAVGWSVRNFVMSTDITVTQGTRYAIIASSPSPTAATASP